MDKINKILIAILMLFMAIGGAKAQDLSVKTNILYDVTSSVNLGLEVGLAPKWSLDLSGEVNPWTFSDNRKFKHWFVQPELRYWLCERFAGHFFALHAHYAQFNLNKVMPFGPALDHRYEGWLVGGGLGYGYQWVFTNRWALEAEIGVGYAYIDYDKYPCANCGRKQDEGHKNYVGPTKAALSLIYIIK